MNQIATGENPGEDVKINVNIAKDDEYYEPVEKVLGDIDSQVVDINAGGSQELRSLNSQDGLYASKIQKGAQVPKKSETATAPEDIRQEGVDATPEPGLDLRAEMEGYKQPGPTEIVSESGEARRVITAGQERQLAKALANSIKGNQEQAAKEESWAVSETPVDATAEQTDMNTNTPIETIDELGKTPEKREAVLGEDLESKAEDIKAIIAELNEARKLSEDKGAEISKVQESIKILGVGGDEIIRLNQEMEKYQVDVSEAEIKLQTELGELTNAIKERPSIVNVLKNSKSAMSVPEIKEVVMSIKDAVPSPGVVNDSEIEGREAQTIIEDIRVIDESTVEVSVGGTLPEAIEQAIEVLADEDAGPDEREATAKMVFHSFLESMIKQFEKDGRLSHKEVYDKVSNLIKNSKKVVVSIEKGNGIIAKVPDELAGIESAPIAEELPVGTDETAGDYDSMAKAA